jgi:hypothetical protein
VGVSDSLAQETSIRARIKSAEKTIIERVVFIEFWLVEFTILSQIVVVSTPVTLFVVAVRIGNEDCSPARIRD